jgi:orotidine-5'-phosphate decarboxylase
MTDSRDKLRDKLIVALDFPSPAEALGFVDRLDGTCRWFKIGMELYYAGGHGLVATLRERGFEVFVDLKMHDIPNTVAGGVRSLAGLGASLLTIHACGGSAMMSAAAEAASLSGAPRLLAVTLLTSMDSHALAATGVEGSPALQVLRLAKLAASSGIDGLVCSSHEVEALRSALAPETLLVTPGIRPAGAELGDQRRVATPGAAIEAGASMLVVGRPITRAPDPAAAVEAILREMDAVAAVGA